MAERDPSHVSPTAHYTGEVWSRNGLSDPAFRTLEGRLMHLAARPLVGVGRLAGAGGLDEYLLARHTLIDSVLERAIEGGQVGQVIEIAAGLSPRGVRMRDRHPDLTYIEADLPGMAARKRDALGTRLGPGHRVAEIDAFADSGPESLPGLAAGLDPGKGLAVVTEGLLNYFPQEMVEGLWARIAAAIAEKPGGVYVSDLHLIENNSGPVAGTFMRGLGIFVRGRIHLHYADEEEAHSALETAGFDETEFHRGSEVSGERGARRVRVIEARPRRGST